ncbi:MULTISPECIES: single-stranded DNA-binding protein [unclassified Pseudonocardia]|jgi:single-strand DNA-binding protein|uniref:single-stranded DNA-binding protein n=1 Tax=unclassified Pseudonocardia TaxID=2619320 RepID=UPI0009634403|nr:MULTISPECIES: single-stranded DNA-binding protein [unclassified Pseudonocardia]MBN9101360.1 single-stranded DNA-binding protein [Pseudonocardia sp.]OJY54338.1 MAG: hypothetical protein BGP03_00495 [Pseudonocardia sp. 73-21]
MDDTTTTFVGRMATAVDGTTLPGGAYKATFRVASSQRRFDQASGEWRDGRSLFMTVVAWRQLAQHAALSLDVGDPVIVHGRIFSREYEKDGRTQTVTEMEATALGPDLAWCTSTVSRKRSAPVPAATGAGAPEETAQAVPGADTGRWDARVVDELDADEAGDIEREIQAHEAAVGV